MTNVTDKTSPLGDIITCPEFLHGVLDYRQGEQRFDEAAGSLPYEYGRLYSACGGPVPVCHKWADGSISPLPEAWVFCVQNRPDIMPEPEMSDLFIRTGCPPAYELERWFLESHPEMRAYIEYRDAPTVQAREAAAHKLRHEGHIRALRGRHIDNPVFKPPDMDAATLARMLDRLKPPPRRRILAHDGRPLLNPFLP